jgi:hypothetical protein
VLVSVPQELQEGETRGVRILRVFEGNTSDVRIFFYHYLIFGGTIMSDQHNTLPPLEGDLKFQMQVTTQMMERMNFVMGKVCNRLDRVERRGNEPGTSTQDVRKVEAELKANSSGRAESPRCVDWRKFNISKEEKRRLRVSNIYAHNAFVMLDKEREPERFAKVYKETNKVCEE